MLRFINAKRPAGRQCKSFNLCLIHSIFLAVEKTDEKLMDSLSYSWINSAHFVIELVLVDVLRKNKKPTRMPQLTYLS